MYVSVYMSLLPFVCSSPQEPFASTISTSLLCSLPLWATTLRCHAIYPTAMKWHLQLFYIGQTWARTRTNLNYGPRQRNTKVVLSNWAKIRTLQTCPSSSRTSSGPTRGRTSAKSPSSTQRPTNATGSKEIKLYCWSMVRKKNLNHVYCKPNFCISGILANSQV